MRRIILAIDHYNQLTYLHVRLKKIGFDVEGVQNERNLEKSLITFNPQLILASTRDVQINGLKMASEIKKNVGFPKIVLFKSSTKSYAAGAFDLPEIDQVLVSPFSIQDVIRCFSDLLKLNAERLLDKYEKVFAQIDEKEGVPSDWLTYSRDSSKKKEEQDQKAEKLKSQTIYREVERQPLDLKKDLNSEERKERFKKFIKKAGPQEVGQLSSQEVEEAKKKIQSEKRTEELEHLDQQRMDFVKALFSHVK